MHPAVKAWGASHHWSACHFNRALIRGQVHIHARALFCDNYSTCASRERFIPRVALVIGSFLHGEYRQRHSLMEQSPHEMRAKEPHVGKVANHRLWRRTRMEAHSGGETSQGIPSEVNLC